MTGTDETLKTLREAFAALAEDADATVDLPDAELVWRAVRRELPPAQTRELVERMTSEPALAEAWRVAVALDAELAAGQPARVVPFPNRRTLRWAVGLAAAAVVVVGVSVTLNHPEIQPPETVFRSAAQAEISSVVDVESLPRDAFDLSWTGAPEGSRATLLVTDETLAPVYRADDLDAAEHRVPADALAGLPDGAAVLWRVELTTPDGRQVSSPAFVQRIAQAANQ